MSAKTQAKVAVARMRERISYNMVLENAYELVLEDEGLVHADPGKTDLRCRLEEIRRDTAERRAALADACRLLELDNRPYHVGDLS